MKLRMKPITTEGMVPSIKEVYLPGWYEAKDEAYYNWRYSPQVSSMITYLVGMKLRMKPITTEGMVPSIKEVYLPGWYEAKDEAYYNGRYGPKYQVRLPTWLVWS